jgi:hypothetical protein
MDIPCKIKGFVDVLSIWHIGRDLLRELLWGLLWRLIEVRLAVINYSLLYTAFLSFDTISVRILEINRCSLRRS